MRLRYNLVDKEDLFLCEHGKFMSHKKFVIEGMLSPCASLFYAPTETMHRYTNNRNKDTQVTITKSNIADKLQKTEDKIILQEEFTYHKKHDEENSAN